MRAEQRLPAVPGLLSEEEVRETGAAMAAVQQPDGALPWVPGGHTDVWNHVESAMALLVAGRREEAEGAYDWCRRTQRGDGSWPMSFVGGAVAQPAAETNMGAYLAVGVWHHWLVCRDRRFVDRMWPTVRAGLDWVAEQQLPFGGLAWVRDYDADGRPGERFDEALLAGSASVYQSLRAGVALAELLDDPQPGWELTGARLGHAVREHASEFADRSRYSMDWYYPVLGGAVRGRAGHERIASRWNRFVVDGQGVRCVSPNPWVTGAETCELVMALDTLGDRQRALRLFGDVQHLRTERGGYWTGYVYPDEAYWPEERTTWTAGAVVLAADALSDTTPGAGIMRGDTLAADFAEFEMGAQLGLECGCWSPDGVAGAATRPS